MMTCIASYTDDSDVPFFSWPQCLALIMERSLDCRTRISSFPLFSIDQHEIKESIKVTMHIMQNNSFNGSFRGDLSPWDPTLSCWLEANYSSRPSAFLPSCTSSIFERRSRVCLSLDSTGYEHSFPCELLSRTHHFPTFTLCPTREHANSFPSAIAFRKCEWLFSAYHACIRLQLLRLIANPLYCDESPSVHRYIRSFRNSFSLSLTSESSLNP